MMPTSPLQPRPWVPDGAAMKCGGQGCHTSFSLINRKHHCRGCGSVFCSSCVVESTLEQYGSTQGPQHACKLCAAPYVHVTQTEAVHLPTAGSDILLQVYNAGQDAADLKVTWDGKAVPFDFVRTSTGLKLRVSAPAGCGSSRILRLRRASTALEGTVKLAYSPPSILRVGELKTEGGELTIFCENVGTGESPVSVYIDGQACDNVLVTQAHKKLTCRAPAGVGVATVRVELEKLAAETDVLRSAPEVLAVDPREVPVSGGPVTFRGNNFGTDPSRIQVVLPEHGEEGTAVDVLDAHTRLECIIPPMPETAKAGENVRLRVIVAGIHSIAPLFIVYSHNARAGKAAAHAKHVDAPLPGRDAGGTASPYANLFATPLQVDRNRQAAGSASVHTHDVGSPAAGGAGAGETPGKKQQPAMVRVGGTISGGGPTLSITPPRQWQADTPDCNICGKGFGLARRRHHCRICGTCACTTCTAYQLQLAPNKPAVRVCTRCHLRVGMLSQMVSIIDAIHALRRALPEEMYETFKDEVIDAVTVPLGPPGTPAPSATPIKR